MAPLREDHKGGASVIKSALSCILGLSLLGLIAQDGFAQRVAHRFPPRQPRSHVTVSGPTISSLPPIIRVGDNFLIAGSGFTPGSAVNFFVATAGGAVNFGPIIPTNILPTSMLAFVPVSVSQGEGVVSVQVVNTDQGHVASNAPLTLLQGDASAGLPSLTGVDGVGLAASSVETGIGVANVETIVTPGETASLTGDGFDVTNGVGVDLFCVCPGQKVGPFFLLPGNPGLGATSLSFTLPSGLQAPGTGPGSFQVTNLGNGSKSAGVSVPIGARMSVTAVSQSGSAVAVDGTGSRA